MRKVFFANGEYYHIYNRGLDKRVVFPKREDMDRFFQSIITFNAVEPIGSIYEDIWNTKLGRKRRSPRLVDIICYCLNPNHFHLLLKQIKDGGISEFMRRIGGYTYYFNLKYKRSGPLYQGTFKSTHIASNGQLLHASAYVNLNNRVHRLGGSTSKSSWNEYIGRANDGICEKGIILDQFASKTEYREFAESSLADILERKEKDRELEKMLLE